MCVCCCSNMFFTSYLQGVPGIIASLALTKTLALICDIRKGRLSDVPANFTGMGRGSTQEPPSRLSVNFDVLHCCRNLKLFLSHQNLLQSKDVESIPRTELHGGSTNFSCQTLLVCLCTFDAFHISNSIRYF